ncbi:MAG: glycogen synthase GlgA [Planctomycetaceae bacterium]|jgi:starch synthase|nr:glycogen synthase GlgA [Planctomycetaceae bacterium]
MKILFVSSEAAPFAQTGGLAEISASLPAALKKLGHDVTVILPAYRSIFQKRKRCPKLEDLSDHFSVPVGNRIVDAALWKSFLPKSEVPVYFIQQDKYFDRDELYTEDGNDYADNCERFIFFSRAVMESLPVLLLEPDIIHSNDWQTGLIPAYQSILYQKKPYYSNIATIHTIHNLAYQGIFWHWDMPLTGIGWEHFTFNELEFYGKLNLMKAGVMFADGITTVSPRYALEIQSPGFGCGMESVLQYRSPMLRGILNGVCSAQWNPETDKNLVTTYSAGNVLVKKPVCKADLQTAFGLPQRPETPLFGVVSRFVYQKGIDLIADVIPTWAENHGVQFVLLGKGDPHIEAKLRQVAERYADNVSVKFGFSEENAHLIEAGADAFLMPSRYEPCGLNQMYSQMYGTVPIVHDTGGLADTVVNLTDETAANSTATGFSFGADSLYDLNTTIWRALSVFWNQRSLWQQLMLNGMRQNWSWEKSAVQYERFYEKVVKK